MHGLGIYEWPSGCKYKGEFKNGKISGKGQIIFSDGEIFEGEFNNYKIDGQGVLWKNDSHKYLFACSDGRKI